VNREMIARNDKLIETQRRNPANLFDRGFCFGPDVVRQPALEILEDRIPGVAADADDIGKAGRARRCSARRWIPR
jgi:hypothetical protein